MGSWMAWLVWSKTFAACLLFKTTYCMHGVEQGSPILPFLVALKTSPSGPIQRKFPLDRGGVSKAIYWDPGTPEPVGGSADFKVWPRKEREASV